MIECRSVLRVQMFRALEGSFGIVRTRSRLRAPVRETREEGSNSVNQRDLQVAAGQVLKGLANRSVVFGRAWL